ncbi:hypothetical protein BGX31_005807 [Mortierella sp. GBA43]|nr:hypothetical protein BGX31_005807 [Mortierella sp. GBA43]
MTATLPRSPLQEETIALFKQYRALIPCAKCFSRNTIQRDGMSDGNLRFKCRPPVSMSLICNKSYSESKIRGMIASVVYGHTLPPSTSASHMDGSSENILSLPLPSVRTTKSSRRPSQKCEDPVLSVEGLHLRDDEDDREYSARMDCQQSYEEMNINGGHPHPVDDRRLSPGDVGSRRSSVQPQYRRPSVTGEESPMLDHEDAILPPASNHLQVPGTPSLDSEEQPLHSHPVHRRRSVTPTGPPAVLRHDRKLHHSHSHPNIGQQRQQQYSEQQDSRNGNLPCSSQNPLYQAQQQRQQQHLQRQVLRRESTQYHGNSHSRPEISAERRLSHPAFLQPSSSSSSGKFLPVNLPGNAHSPALSSSSRFSPSYEPLQPALGQPNTPHIGSLPGQGDRYEGSDSPTSYYQRRMSQPHPSFQRYGQLPPPPGAALHHYDRRASDVEEYGYQHREKYEKLSASTMRITSGSRLSVPSSYSPITPHLEPIRLSHSLSGTNSTNAGQQHAYQRHQDSSVYYQQPSREDMDPHSSEETDDRPYARMRQSYKRFSTSRSLSRVGSYPNLYSTASNASNGDLDSAMPRNRIRLTCFPNRSSDTSSTANETSTTTTLDPTDAMAVQLSQSSKVVIEITQPRALQAFTGFEDVPEPLFHPSQQRMRTLRHTVSQPNLMMSRSTSSVLGRRRSASPDDMSFGSSKKRRADSVSGSAKDDDEVDARLGSQTPVSTSAAVAEAAAAAVVAAAANAARQQQQQQQQKSPKDNGTDIPIVGMDMIAGNTKDVGLGVSVLSVVEPTIDSPTIEALGVAKASSYVPLEDQKEMGIDYSLFTRVETAGWRILIPPNVVASFRSEDFGLTLKPKIAQGLDSVLGEDGVLGHQEDDVSKDTVLMNPETRCEAIVEEEKQQQQQQQQQEILQDEERAINQKDQETSSPNENITESDEEEMDELEDE